LFATTRAGRACPTRSTLDFSIEARVRDLDAVVDHLALESFDLIAIAHGVVTAIAYAARHPKRVRNLVLVDGYARGALFAELPSVRAYSSFRNIAEESWEAYTLAVSNGNLNFSDSVRAQVMAARLRDSMSPQAVRGFYDALPSIDVTALLPRIVTPTLVISVKGRTNLDPEWSRELASRIPGARFVTRESSELMLVDEAVAAIVEEFLGIEAASNPARAAARPEAGAFRTILFTDIVGHTEMMHRLGDTKGRDVLREHERITRETLTQHGGAEVKTMGDGFMASFGSVTSAMECAIALQRAFATHTESMAEPLHVRVGLNAGEPIEEDGDLFGATVILASRIAARAGAGEILVPDTVRGLLSGKGFMFGDRGEFVPKGFDEAVRLWDVRWRE
jgi:class 3 adenylate cyclase